MFHNEQRKLNEEIHTQGEKRKVCLTKLPQLNSLKNFVEETLIVSNIWNILCNILQNVESAI